MTYQILPETKEWISDPEAYPDARITHCLALLRVEGAAELYDHPMSFADKKVDYHGYTAAWIEALTAEQKRRADLK